VHDKKAALVLLVDRILEILYCNAGSYR